MKLQTFGSPNHNGDIKCLCPYHNDNNPSAMYNVRTGLFYCYTCKTGKNSLQLKCDNIEIDEIEMQALVVPKYGRDDEQWRTLWKYGATSPKMHKQTFDYLLSRQVDEETVKKYDIRTTDTTVMFPFKSNTGAVIGFYERRLVEVPKYVLRGTANVLWPYRALQDEVSATFDHEKQFYLVEGVFGALRMRKHGFNAFATLGTKTRKAKVIVDILSQFVPVENIVVVFDNDEAGHISTMAFMQQGCKAFLPGIEADEIDANQAQLIRNNAISLRYAKAHDIDVASILL